MALRAQFLKMDMVFFIFRYRKKCFARGEVQSTGSPLAWKFLSFVDNMIFTGGQIQSTGSPIAWKFSSVFKELFLQEGRSYRGNTRSFFATPSFLHSQFAQVHRHARKPGKDLSALLLLPLLQERKIFFRYSLIFAFPAALAGAVEIAAFSMDDATACTFPTAWRFQCS